MVNHVAPPGWPRQVRPPDAPGWEHTATNWLLDICPPEYRAHAGVASQAACRRGLSEARSELRDVVDPEVVEVAVQTFQREEARLAACRRAVGLVEEALRGRRYVARL